MDVQDNFTRQFLVRLVAKRREYIIASIKKFYPDKATQIENHLQEYINSRSLELIVKPKF
jgi:hypothetical protein